MSSRFVRISNVDVDFNDLSQRPPANTAPGVGAAGLQLSEDLTGRTAKAATAKETGKC